MVPEEHGYVVIVHILLCVRIVILPLHITQLPRKDSYAISATTYLVFPMNVRNVHDMDLTRSVLAYNASKRISKNSFRISLFRVSTQITRRKERVFLRLFKKAILSSLRIPLLALSRIQILNALYLDYSNRISRYQNIRWKKSSSMFSTMRRNQEKISSSRRNSRNIPCSIFAWKEIIRIFSRI